MSGDGYGSGERVGVEEGIDRERWGRSIRRTGFLGRTFAIALGLLPGEGYSLVIAGAVLSISLNPFLFRTIEPIESWLRRHPRLLQYLESRSAGELAKLRRALIPMHYGGTQSSAASGASVV